MSITLLKSAMHVNYRNRVRVTPELKVQRSAWAVRPAMFDYCLLAGF